MTILIYDLKVSELEALTVLIWQTKGSMLEGASVSFQIDGYLGVSFMSVDVDHKTSAVFSKLSDGTVQYVDLPNRDSLRGYLLKYFLEFK